MLTVKGFQIGEVAETGVEESDSSFDWSNGDHGPSCSWNLQAIAVNISTKLRNHTAHGEQAPVPLFKSKLGNSALEILLDTLIQGIDDKKGNGPENVTELIQDPKTGEEWPEDPVKKKFKVLE